MIVGTVESLTKTVWSLEFELSVLQRVNQTVKPVLVQGTTETRVYCSLKTTGSRKCSSLIFCEFILFKIYWHICSFWAENFNISPQPQAAVIEH